MIVGAVSNNAVLVLKIYVLVPVLSFMCIRKTKVVIFFRYYLMLFSMGFWSPPK